MPIGPKTIQTVRSEIIERAYFEIDSVLRDQVKSRAHLKGDTDDYYYSFVFPGLLNADEKHHLIGLYSVAGWEKVTVVNSGEVNERPGLFMVRLYSKSNSRFLK
jgi:hypothetical protein